MIYIEHVPESLFEKSATVGGHFLSGVLIVALLLLNNLTIQIMLSTVTCGNSLIAEKKEETKSRRLADENS